MSNGERTPGDGGPDVKVVDRRRFRQDGERVTADAEGEGEPQAGGRPGAAQDAGSAAASADAAAEERIAAQAARIDELTRAYAALVEDNKAFRTRLEREKERVVDAERARVAQALLEAADELERALAAVSGGERPGGVLGTLVQGVELTLAGLAKRIGELGAVRIAVLGQPFDPRVAEAVDAVAVTDASQDGRVVQEVRAGYRIGDRILRPARVRVGRIPQA